MIDRCADFPLKRIVVLLRLRVGVIDHIVLPGSAAISAFLRRQCDPEKALKGQSDDKRADAGFSLLKFIFSKVRQGLLTFDSFDWCC